MNDRNCSHQALMELDAQVERGQLFTHTALGESASRLAQLQSIVHGLADSLMAKGVLTSGELIAAVHHVDEELEARGEQLGPGIRIRIDPVEEEPGAEAVVDCESRLSLCQAVCCRLNFALSVDEIEASQVRWDLGMPYFVRKRENGCCTHLNAEHAGCTVYADRPRVCRRYSCAHDQRIWTDFAARELNTDWIAANLGQASRLQVESVRMHFMPGATMAGSNEEKDR